LIAVLLVRVDYKQTIIRILGPFCNIYPSFIIYDTDRIFHSVAVDIVIAGISYSVAISIFLFRIIGVRTAIFRIIQSVAIIIVVERAIHFPVEFEQCF